MPTKTTPSVDPTFCTPTALADLAAQLARSGPSPGGTIYASDVAYLLLRANDFTFITRPVVAAAEQWLTDWEKATAEMRRELDANGGGYHAPWER